MALSEEERKARNRESARRWREANPQNAREKAREHNRRWREANRDKSREANRRWRQANLEKRREDKRAMQRTRRARKRGALPPGAPRVTADVASIRRALFRNHCCYCGSSGPLHDDHFVPLARGGQDVPSNIVPACERCNLSKGAKPVEAWYLSQPFFSEQRWEAILRHTRRSEAVAVQLSLLALAS